MPSDDPEIRETTSAKNWKTPRRQGFLLDLPSGNTARVRRTLDIYHMMKAGTIPNPLSGIINEMMKGERTGIDMKELEPQALQQMLRLLDNCAAGSMVDPPCVIPPDDAPSDWEPADENAISVADLTLEDKMFIFSFSQGAAGDLESFRAQQAAVVANVPDGEGVPVQAEQPAGVGG
jgi:hypothetical protein